MNLRIPRKEKKKLMRSQPEEILNLGKRENVINVVKSAIQPIILESVIGLMN